MRIMPSDVKGKMRVGCMVILLYVLQVIGMKWYPDSNIWFFCIFVTLGILTFMVDSISACWTEQGPVEADEPIRFSRVP